jgi:sec-independent protein translocase protein TatB
MFDIGFSEMLVCAVVALVVIGPEKLPRVARTMGHLFGRLQRYVSQVKSDIHREMEAADLGKVKTEFESAARSFQAEVESKANETEREVRDLQRDVSDAASALEPTSTAEATPASEPPSTPSPQLELGIGEPEAQPSRKQSAG